MATRAIKFRVFFYDGTDLSTGTMYHKKGDIGLGDMGIDENIFNNFELKPFDNCSIIMQYTGLKDKNGVEIYEGDIMKSSHGNIHTVWFEGSSFRCGLNGGFVSWHLWKSLEVIANIHQNQELLK